MQLYFIAAEEGEMNLDWFVVADSVEEAAELWLDMPEVLDFIPLEYTVFLVGAAPHEFGIIPRTLCWHNDLQQVTPK